MRIELIWARQGTVQWEDWWVEEEGYSRHHVPNLDEHVGFANFDLKRSGLPEIVRGPSGELYVDLDPFRVTGMPANAGVGFAAGRAIAILHEVLQQHGFEFKGTPT